MYIPVQLNPSPSNPKLHVQLYDPMVLVQLALPSQEWVSSLHSFTSVREEKEIVLWQT